MAKTYKKRVTTTVPTLETPSFKDEMPNFKINSNADVKVTHDYAITIKTGEKWYKRIWNYITNPFTYIFGGKNKILNSKTNSYERYIRN